MGGGVCGCGSGGGSGGGGVEEGREVGGGGDGGRWFGCGEKLRENDNESCSA